ncbi:uncharacterized protein GGS22DRAFT_13902 [Annulohypoxylon maeteangense]|uniref:uncharacterized protein n=1 Tax=Annulohypoxylon maeteangense TaxID=1927788 RepID=UPI002008DC10|nr:uncharacterized protein GGS22DRAFT_13902 [Annulohypoxylon maeteangense]KAI0890463.1 hypothetical protein GGS22DRAFT_13902 [Annulohypoxylon maeteangense]
MSEQTAPTPEGDRTAQCASCLDSLPATEMHTLPCLHSYCADCARMLFRLSFQSDGSFPPRCCNEPVDLTPRLVTALGEEIWSVYIAKRKESKTDTRIYCSNADCGSFIQDEYRFTGFAICSECKSLTCMECKAPCHDGDCNPHDPLAELRELAKKEGWLQCYKCGNIIEKVDGCDRIACTCGVKVCYKCSKDIEECTCKKDNGPPAHGVQEDGEGGAAPPEMAPPDIAAPEAAALDPAALNPAPADVAPPGSNPPATTSELPPPSRRDNQPENGCNHHSKKERVEHIVACPRCQRSVSSYIIQCKRCGLHACWRCYKLMRHDEKKNRTS